MKKLLIALLLLSFISGCVSSEGKSIKEALEERDYTCTLRTCEKTRELTYKTHDFQSVRSIHLRKLEVSEDIIYPIIGEEYTIVQMYTLTYNYKDDKVETVEVKLYYASRDDLVLFNEGIYEAGEYDSEILDEGFNDLYFNESSILNRIEDFSRNTQENWKTSFDQWTN